MGLPLQTRVFLWVEGTAVTDITDDLLEFCFTETIQSKASTIDVKVRDTDLKYRNRFFIKKGSKVAAQFQVLYGGNGTGKARGTGDMWVDTCECELKPRTMTFKANSLNPALEKDGKKHLGAEGRTNKENAKTNLTPGNQSFARDKDISVVGESGGTDEANDKKKKRDDPENESSLAYNKRKAKE